MSKYDQLDYQTYSEINNDTIPEYGKYKDEKKLIFLMNKLEQQTKK